MKEPPPKQAAVQIHIGPEIISDFERSRRAEGRLWAEGYTKDELDRAQNKFGHAFPPDLIEFFLERRPVRAWDWRVDEDRIRAAMAWPLEGLLFDVERNDLWWPEWGERPVQADQRAEVLRAVVGHAPKLIPLYSHRYLPSEPHEDRNPVFSIYQSDVIHYGVDLADYFAREFEGGVEPEGATYKRIPFWSDLVTRNEFLR